MKEKTTSQNIFAWASILRGTIVGLGSALVGILLFAFVLRFTNIADSIIVPVNQVIKGVSIFAGVFFGLKNNKSGGLLNGALIGFSFTLVAFLVFSLLDGSFCFDKTLITDLIFGCILGGICGIIDVNLKKN